MTYPLIRGGGDDWPFLPDTVDEERDDGTMPENVAELEEAIAGHRIVKAEQGDLSELEFGEKHYWDRGKALILTLDDGRRVALQDTDDCCAYTDLEGFLLHPESVDHVITKVVTTEGYSTWHILADFGEVMRLNVDWSCGNPFYYSYGFRIRVSNTIEGEVVEQQHEIES